MPSLTHTGECSRCSLPATFCDGARAEDGHGFNKIDSRIGRELALRDRLTARQAALAYMIARKYKRQVDVDLYDAIYKTVEGDSHTWV